MISGGDRHQEVHQARRTISPKKGEVSSAPDKPGLLETTSETVSNEGDLGGCEPGAACSGSQPRVRHRQWRAHTQTGPGAASRWPGCRDRHRHRARRAHGVCRSGHGAEGGGEPPRAHRAREPGLRRVAGTECFAPAERGRGLSFRLVPTWGRREGRSRTRRDIEARRSRTFTPVQRPVGALCRAGWGSSGPLPDLRLPCPEHRGKVGRIRSRRREVEVRFNQFKMGSDQHFGPVSVPGPDSIEYVGVLVLGAVRGAHAAE